MYIFHASLAKELEKRIPRERVSPGALEKLIRYPIPPFFVTSAMLHSGNHPPASLQRYSADTLQIPARCMNNSPRESGGGVRRGRTMKILGCRRRYVYIYTYIHLDVSNHFVITRSRAISIYYFYNATTSWGLQPCTMTLVFRLP